MKVFLILGLVFAGFTSQVASVKEQTGRTTNKQNVRGLEISITAHKQRYKPTDKMQLDILLTNYGREDVFIFSELEFGYSASLVIHIRNAAGKEVQPFFDDHTFTSPDDKSAFVKLLPRHFLGTNFFTPVDVLNMKRPGKYSIYVEYRSPFSATEVKLNPFWGKEKGTIRSNVVNVEVVR